MCYNRVEAIRQLWYQKSFLPGAWAKIYRREIFREHRFTEGILFEDIDIMHRLFWSSNKLVYQSSPDYGYLHREGSITTAAFSVRNGDILPIAEKLLDFARSYCPELLPAAQSYAVSAAFRILLNAPEDHPELETLRSQAGQLLDACKASVRKDPQIRRKTRYALYLYDICPALMKLIYKRKNRWK